MSPVLPYDRQVIDWLSEERVAGRTQALATASHEHFAVRIAEHLGIFDKVFATSQQVNMSSIIKRDALVAEYGEKGFDYVGNSHDDVPVWQAADRAYVVNPLNGVERAARKHGNVERVFENRPPPLKVWARSLRLHQWLKNVLIFVPLLSTSSTHMRRSSRNAWPSWARSISRWSLRGHCPIRRVPEGCGRGGA